MEKKNLIGQIEEITNKIDAENDFERTVELFAAAAVLVKSGLEQSVKSRGRLTEIIRDVDGFIEKEVKC
jgi:hypothetical protein